MPFVNKKDGELKDYFTWIVDGNGCWNVVSHKGENGGYVRISICGVVDLAHRVSWRIENGPIPEGNVIRHKCDNPSCINPDHLEPGTKADNSADMAERGRSLHGEKHHTAKLTEGDVLKILKDTVSSTSDLAGRFGVSDTNIKSIQRGKLWKRYIKTNGLQHLVDKQCERKANRPRFKLSKKNIAEIIQNRTDSHINLARKYGVDKKTINNLRLGKTWVNVIKDLGLEHLIRKTRKIKSTTNS